MQPGDASCLAPSAEPLPRPRGCSSTSVSGLFPRSCHQCQSWLGSPILVALVLAWMQLSWRQEADLAQPLVGPTVPLHGAAGPVMEQQGEHLGRAGAFPKKA